ncbi:hypothetical protein GUR46_18435 [Stenotrophomonas maltophilia]|uniref:hypothetical protein n=1 Tax=Stenotrophomonas maltophilia TaxID=40324 RepID=UPI001F2B5F70|nr:hypothetical protein [Stenotrophomonas maltophilia]MCF3530853.1 hypothetical protein [Stenotrophomonas maltophilia]MCF3534737.1 hypothetical protein [Stenotrophomonas maltophilia]
MADIDTARRFLAAEFENAGLPHVAGDILAGTSPFGRGAYIAAVAAALASPCAKCGGRPSLHTVTDRTKAQA